MTLKSSIGYKGRITPLVDLLKDAGREPRDVQHGFIGSSDTQPSFFTHNIVLGDPNNGRQRPGKEGMQKPTKGRNSWLPPDQNWFTSRGGEKPGPGRGKAGLNIGGKESYKGSRLEVANETQRDISFEKYGMSVKPDPVFGLPPMDPVRQMGYQPDQLEQTEVVRFGQHAWHGQFTNTKSGSQPPAEAHSSSRPKMSKSGRGLATTAVQNYIWSTRRHRRLVGNFNRKPEYKMPNTKNIPGIGT
jgi:hypothetical protein